MWFLDLQFNVFPRFQSTWLFCYVVLYNRSRNECKPGQDKPSVNTKTIYLQSPFSNSTLIWKGHSWNHLKIVFLDEINIANKPEYLNKTDAKICGTHRYYTPHFKNQHHSHVALIANRHQTRNLQQNRSLTSDSPPNKHKTLTHRRPPTPTDQNAPRPLQTRPPS